MTTPFLNKVARATILAASVADLRGLANAPALLPSGTKARTADAGLEWTWNPSDTRADDGSNVVKPTDVGGGAGRFVRATPLLNLRAFGAFGDGTTDDTAAIQAALDAAAVFDRDVYVPAGTYLSQTVEMRAGTTLRGQGKASLFKRKTGSSAIFFEAVGTDARDLTFDSVAFDVNRDENFVAAIFVHRAKDGGGNYTGINPRNIYVGHCYFFSSVAPTPGDTIHAILVEGGVEGCWFVDSFTNDSQIKISESDIGAGPGVFVERNYCVNSNNYAISVVANQVTDAQVDVRICGNVIVNPHDGGIFFGNDDTGTKFGTAIRFLVCDNDIFGTSAVAGIIGRTCLTSEDWIVARNVVRNPDGAPPTGGGGIIIEDTDAGGALSRLILVDNAVYNADLQGIKVYGEIRSLVLARNVVWASRGIEVAVGNGGGPLSLVDVFDNQVADSTDHGISVLSLAGTVDCRVMRNAVRNATGFGVRLDTTGGGSILAEVELNQTRQDGGHAAQTYGLGVTGGGTTTFVRPPVNNEWSGSTGPVSGYSFAATYAVTHHTDARSLDETGATLGQVANTLGSLIKDLIAQGTIRGTVTP